MEHSRAPVPIGEYFITMLLHYTSRFYSTPNYLVQCQVPTPSWRRSVEQKVRIPSKEADTTKIKNSPDDTAS